MKWIVLVLILVLSIIGLEIYGNSELVRNGYTGRQLTEQAEEVRRENRLLERKISFFLSLNELDRYAREELRLIEQVEIRFLKRIATDQVDKFPPPVMRSTQE